MSCFHLISANLEDRYPDALPEGTDKAFLLQEDFMDTIRPERVHKRIDNACVAFLWGRTEEGKSICVIVEGVRPKLFFDADDSTSLLDLKMELQKEVAQELRDTPSGLVLDFKKYANFNGYEPDESTASGRKVHRYVQVQYPSMRAFRKAVGLRKEDDVAFRCAHRDKSPLPPRKYRLAHEYNVDPMTRFLREYNLLPGGWNQVVEVAPSTTSHRLTTCDMEVYASEVRLIKDRFHMSPYVTLYYDLETLSLDPDTGGIIQASMVFECRDKVEKHCVCVGNVSPLEGTALHCMASEEKLLHRVRKLVVEKDPDFVVAYNGVNFDNKFLAVRAEARHATKDKVEVFFFMSRFALRPSRLRELTLASSGMGDNKFNYLDMVGRATIDFFVKFKVDEPSEISWSLSHFARKYLPNEDKEDMDYREIPVLQRGSNDDRRRLASYCVHDSYLLHLLNKARNILVIVLQFAQVFGVLPEWVYFRGQQVRYISQLLEGVRNLEAIPLLIQTPPNGFVGMFDDTGFEGATVNDPITGFYHDPIPTLDWKSLYPSIMLAHNLCHSTHVVNESLRSLEGVVAHHIKTLGVQWQEVTKEEVEEVEGKAMSRQAPGEEKGEHDKPTRKVEILHDPQLRLMLRKRRREIMMQETGTTENVKRRRIIDISKDDWDKVQPHHGPLTSTTLVPLKGDDDESSSSSLPTLSLPPSEEDAEEKKSTMSKTTLYARPVGEHTTYFTTKHRGILPTILENLLAERVRCKKQMKEHAKKAKQLREMDPVKAAEHASLADVFDGRQLAVKVSANSVYGACGAGASGKCPNKDVSETVTFEGRETMTILKEILVDKYPGIVVIYGDTDSVMVKFDGIHDVKSCAKLAHEAADYVTEEFARRGYPDMILEFEKIFFPYLLLKKKRYIGRKYEPEGDEMICKGIDAKGVETERKDTLPFLKKIYIDVRNELMYNKDAVAALKCLEAHLWRLIRDEVPFEELVLSKGLKSSYKDPSTQVQCCVNEKKRQREPGSESAVGDRVWYVIVNGPENAKTTELAEDPDYAKKNKLKLNRLWYFEHAIRTPMTSFFAKIQGVDAECLFEVVRAELKREKLGGSSLRNLIGASSSGHDDPLLAPQKRHIPRPPPPPPPSRRKKAAK